MRPFRCPFSWGADGHGRRPGLALGVRRRRPRWRMCLSRSHGSPRRRNVKVRRMREPEYPHDAIAGASTDATATGRREARIPPGLPPASNKLRSDGHQPRKPRSQGASRTGDLAKAAAYGRFSCVIWPTRLTSTPTRAASPTRKAPRKATGELGCIVLDLQVETMTNSRSKFPLPHRFPSCGGTDIARHARCRNDAERRVWPRMSSIAVVTGRARNARLLVSTDGRRNVNAQSPSQKG